MNAVELHRPKSMSMHNRFLRDGTNNFTLIWQFKFKQQFSPDEKSNEYVYMWSLYIYIFRFTSVWFVVRLRQTDMWWSVNYKYDMTAMKIAEENPE